MVEESELMKREGIHAYFDCFGGVTTSAMLAACLDANNDDLLIPDIQVNFQKELPNLDLKSMQVSKCKASSMSATVVKVVLEEETTAASCTFSLQEIHTMLTSADCNYIPPSVYKNVEMVFAEFITAEKEVHGQSNEQTNFTASTIIEIVAILLALHKLGVKTVSCGPLPLGEGSTWSEQDGLLPIPSPMTLQLLIGMPTCPGSPLISKSSDLTTPMAAALLRVLTRVSDRTTSGPSKKPSCFVTQSVGVGADSVGSESRVLRLLLGASGNDNTDDEESFRLTASPLAPVTTAAESNIHEQAVKWKVDALTQLEANLDDMTAEALSFAVELLLDNGALDAWVVPIVMKKGRAAHTLHCLCHSRDSTVNNLLELMFRHTTTLGIRVHRNVERAALRRSFLSVSTPFHESNVSVKIGYLGEEVVSVKAEFDDCAAIARETSVPIQEVADNANQQAHIQLQPP